MTIKSWCTPTQHPFDETCLVTVSFFSFLFSVYTHSFAIFELITLSEEKKGLFVTTPHGCMSYFLNGMYT